MPVTRHLRHQNRLGAAAYGAHVVTESHPGPTVNKADIIDRIAEGTGLTKLETEAVVSGFMTVVADALKRGEHVELRGFGTFRSQHRESRIVRNPSTGDPMTLPDRYVPVFKASKQLRGEVDEAVRRMEDD